MVEFCPSCGSILVPQRKGGQALLVCRSCGYTKKAAGESYMQREKLDRRKKTKVTAVSRATEEKMSEEKREMLKEYYEVFLATMESGEE